MAPQFDRPRRERLRAAGCSFIRPGKGSHEIWHSPITERNFAVPIGIPSRHTAMRFCGRPAFRRRFERAIAAIQPQSGRTKAVPWHSPAGSQS